MRKSIVQPFKLYPYFLFQKSLQEIEEQMYSIVSGLNAIILLRRLSNLKNKHSFF
jgi:hypothetical protein